MSTQTKTKSYLMKYVPVVRDIAVALTIAFIFYILFWPSRDENSIAMLGKKYILVSVFIMPISALVIINPSSSTVSQAAFYTIYLLFIGICIMHAVLYYVFGFEILKMIVVQLILNIILLIFEEFYEYEDMPTKGP